MKRHHVKVILRVQPFLVMALIQSLMSPESTTFKVQTPLVVALFRSQVDQVAAIIIAIMISIIVESLALSQGDLPESRVLNPTSLAQDLVMLIPLATYQARSLVDQAPATFIVALVQSLVGLDIARRQAILTVLVKNQVQSRVDQSQAKLTAQATIIVALFQSLMDLDLIQNLRTLDVGQSRVDQIQKALMAPSQGDLPENRVLNPTALAQDLVMLIPLATYQARSLVDQAPATFIVALAQSLVGLDTALRLAILTVLVKNQVQSRVDQSQAKLTAQATIVVALAQSLMDLDLMGQVLAILIAQTNLIVALAQRLVDQVPAILMDHAPVHPIHTIQVILIAVNIVSVRVKSPALSQKNLRERQSLTHMGLAQALAILTAQVPKQVQKNLPPKWAIRVENLVRRYIHPARKIQMVAYLLSCLRCRRQKSQ